MIKHRLKILLIVFFFHSQFDCFAQGSWTQIDIPTQQNLSSVFFVDSLTGWAVGDAGTIIHTIDGGENWILQQSNTENDIVDVFFLNSNLGWASSFAYTSPPYGTLLLKTTNGGIDWLTEPYPEENIFINCILFLDSLNGWMGGSPHAIVRTIDGGNIWQQAEVDTSNLAFFPVLSIQFYDEQYGYASGGLFDIAGVTWRTNNGGDNWYAIDGSDAPADEIHELFVFDSLCVMGAGGDPDFGYGVGIISTIDGGYNWEYDEIAIQGNAFDLDFVNKAEVWAPLGPQSKFIYSLDTGSTWMQIPTPNSTIIYDVIFPDSLHGYAVGNDGAMLKFKAAAPVGIEPIVAFSKEVILHQNYPNPFKTNTNITFELPDDYVGNLALRLKIYDIFGNEVLSFDQEKYVSGTNKLEVDCTNLSAGIYYYQLTISEKIINVKRMVLIR